MDLSLIAAANSAISAARDLVKATVGVRDFNQLATTLSALKEQLLKAQDSLFDHNGQLFALQQEVFTLKDALRQKESELLEAQQTIAELKQKRLALEQYEHFQFPHGGWAYRLKASASDPENAPTYCASCFDEGKLAVMQPGTRMERAYLLCKCGAKVRRY